MARAQPSPTTTCELCGKTLFYANRLNLLAWVDGELRETTWLCWICGLAHGGVPESSYPMIEQLAEEAQS